MPRLEQTIRETPGVLGVHDLHVWTVGSGMIACSCHILVSEQSIASGQQVLRSVVSRLRESFGIGHTTIQVEVEGCDSDHLYCNLRPGHHEPPPQPGRPEGEAGPS